MTGLEGKNKMTEKKSTSFIVLTKSMIRDLKLKNTELLIYAIIYSFSKENAGKFYGGLKYLMDWTNSSKTTVINSLKILEKNNLIKKEIVQEGRIRYCTYSVIEEETNSDEVKKLNNEVKEFNDEVKKFNSRGKESLPNNKIYNKYNNKINNTSSSHSEPTPFDDDTPNSLGSEDSLSVSSSSPNPFDDDDIKTATSSKTVDSQPKVTSSISSAKPKKVKTKNQSSAKKGSYPREYYNNIISAYNQNYQKLLDTGKVKVPLPRLVPSAIMKKVKQAFDDYGYESVLKAVKESVNDEWLIEQNYKFFNIFGPQKLNMLINGIKFENSNSVTNSLVRQSLSSRENFKENW